MEKDTDIDKTCSVEISLSVLGGKWKPLILLEIKNKPKRFNEIKKSIPKITSRMLNIQLKELEKNNLINRKSYDEVPPRVEYILSDYGQSIGPIMDLLEEWGEKHKNLVLKKQ